MTEEEAKTRWCPFARPVFGRDGGGRSFVLAAEGRKATVEPDGRLRNVEQTCIASACMAWRGASPGRGGPTGYCGLAGVPS